MSSGQEDSSPPVRQRRWKLLYQLLILFLVVGVGPLVISSRTLMNINQSTLETQILESHTQLVRSAAGSVKTFLRQVRETLHGVARVEGQVALLDEAQRQNLLIHFLDSYNYLRGLKVMDSSGRELTDVSRVGADELWSGMGQAVRDRGVNHALSGDYNVSQPFSTPTADTSFVVMSVPVRDGEGRVIGALMAIVSLAEIQNQIAGIRFGSTGQAYLVDREGMVVAHRDLELIRRRQSLSGLEIVGSNLLAGHQTVITMPFLDPHGRQMLGAFSSIEEDRVGWGVIIDQPREEAYHSYLKMRNETVKWVVLGVLLATGIGGTFAQKISKPIRTFAQKSMSIASGDFKGQIDIKARNEIGQLAETFNHMTKQLDLYDRNMRELFMSTIKSLAAAIDAKDPYTRGHSDRVSQFSLAIGRELGLSAKAMERLQIAALLHDVGKIGINDSVLRKPEKLTDQEFALIKKHPSMGANIMGPIKQLKDIIPGMRHHHEAVDGSGYPDGLAGDKIPVLARIIAVADTFDAMTSDRLYQKAMEDEFVLNTLKKLSGKRYDPRMVKAFITAHPKIRQQTPVQTRAQA